jgi:hypothetical protein
MSDVFSMGRRAKVERQRALAEALTRAPEPDPAAERELDALADAVADRLTRREEEDDEPEPERRPAESFDGGARQPVRPPPEDHGRWLARVIREGRADAGANF